MLFSTIVAAAFFSHAAFASTIPYQHTFANHDAHINEFDFYDWCIASKAAFLESFKTGGTKEWTLVMGNEAADTDSMVSALGMAYHLSHRKKNPVKAVALLQVDSMALGFRPENVLVMKNAGLQDPTKELLTLDQLPWHRAKVAQMVQGLVLTDHNRPLSFWQNVPVLGIVDHHEDRGINMTAQPRMIEMIGSATSLVSSLILDEPYTEGTIPKELADLLFSTIAFDTNGLKKKKTHKRDLKSAKGMFELSSFAGQDMYKVAKNKKKHMKKAEADIGHLNVTQLLARDYKGDMIYNSTKPIMVGITNVPYAMADLIAKSSNGTEEAVAHETRAWAAKNEIDILLTLTKKKHSDGSKTREVLLFTKHGSHLNSEDTERMYHHVRDKLPKELPLDFKPWHNESYWGHQRFAWKQHGEGAGRKIIRPILDKVLQEW